MEEFRIGRKYAQAFYPGTGRGSGTSLSARNFASGPATDTTLSIDGTAIPWSHVDSGSPGTNVPITPAATGVIVVAAVISVSNPTGDEQTVEVVVDVNDSDLPVPASESVSIAAGGFATLPVLVEKTGLPVGTTANVSIILFPSADSLQAVAASSTVDVHEASTSSG